MIRRSLHIDKIHKNKINSYNSNGKGYVCLGYRGCIFICYTNSKWIFVLSKFLVDFIEMKRDKSMGSFLFMWTNNFKTLQHMYRIPFLKEANWDSLQCLKVLFIFGMLG